MLTGIMIATDTPVTVRHRLTARCGLSDLILSISITKVLSLSRSHRYLILAASLPSHLPAPQL